jgi:hypothetical protein
LRQPQPCIRREERERKKEKERRMTSGSHHHMVSASANHLTKLGNGRTQTIYRVELSKMYSFAVPWSKSIWDLSWMVKYKLFQTRMVLTVKFHQPSHEFTFGVGMTFVSYPLVPTPLVWQDHSCMSVSEFSVYAGF